MLNKKKKIIEQTYVHFCWLFDFYVTRWLKESILVWNSWKVAWDSKIKALTYRVFKEMNNICSVATLA